MRTCNVQGPVTQLGSILLVAGTPFELTPLRPLWLDAAYRAFLEAVPTLCCAPPFFTVKSTHGYGGLYVGGGGPIILGMADVAKIARTFVTRWGIARSRLRKRQEFVGTFQRVATCVLAHELGHALAEQGFHSPYAHPESTADYLAGRLEAALGIDRLFGVRTFALLGCHSVPCSHPSPRLRADAYARGHAEQVVSMIAFH